MPIPNSAPWKALQDLDLLRMRAYFALIGKRKKGESQPWAPPTMTLNVATARTHRWAPGSSLLTPMPGYPAFSIQLKPHYPDDPDGFV
ncbi:GD23343 [Drosophila simulans]|uniref:GD23343 n=1 Tax=Drosophila simulans TaxID=7240 RepID=B4Q3L8_DROSI|nr:GD23343 [Drosophila simulans]